MKLVVKTYDPANSTAAQPGQKNFSGHSLDPWNGTANRFLSIPSGACMNSVNNPCRHTVCQSIGECVKNRQLSAPTGEPDFFGC